MQDHDERYEAGFMVLTPTDIGPQWPGTEETPLHEGNFQGLADGSSHSSWSLSNGSMIIHAWLVVFGSPQTCETAFKRGIASYIPVADSVNYACICIGDGSYIVETNQDNMSSDHGYPTVEFSSGPVLCTLFTDPHDWRAWMQETVLDLAMLHLEKNSGQGDD